MAVWWEAGHSSQSSAKPRTEAPAAYLCVAAHRVLLGWYDGVQKINVTWLLDVKQVSSPKYDKRARSSLTS